MYCGIHFAFFSVPQCTIHDILLFERILILTSKLKQYLNFWKHSMYAASGGGLDLAKSRPSPGSFLFLFLRDRLLRASSVYASAAFWSCPIKASMSSKQWFRICWKIMKINNTTSLALISDSVDVRKSLVETFSESLSCSDVAATHCNSKTRKRYLLMIYNTSLLLNLQCQNLFIFYFLKIKHGQWRTKTGYFRSNSEILSLYDLYSAVLNFNVITWSMCMHNAISRLGVCMYSFVHSLRLGCFFFFVCLFVFILFCFVLICFFL